MVSSEVNFKLKVSDWRKEPTDDIAVRRKSRLAEERPVQVS